MEHYETLAVLGKRAARKKISRASINHYEFDHNNLSIFIEYREDDNDLLDSLGMSLEPFRKGGLRHKIGNESYEDEGMSTLIKQEVAEIKKINQIIKKGPLTNEDSLFVKRYSDLDGDMSQIKESIRSNYLSERREYMIAKIQRVKDELINFATITIDEVDIKNDLECKFYIHPNMLEKGILCHYNIDTLVYGEHLLRVQKNDRVRRIPFRKIKQNQ